MNPNFQFHPASAGIGCADAIDFGNDMKRFWLGKAGHTADSHADAWTVAMLWQSPWLRSSFGLLWGHVCLGNAVLACSRERIEAEEKHCMMTF